MIEYYFVMSSFVIDGVDGVWDGDLEVVSVVD